MSTGIYERKSRTQRIRVICKQCGKALWLVPWIATKKKYCSLSCYHKSDAFLATISANGKRVGQHRRRHGHSWGDKISIAKTGKRRPDLLVNGYASIDGKQWRMAVLKRDRNRCVDCGKSATHVHHIKPRAQLKTLKELYDINNGVTLCNPCHMRRHRLHDYRGRSL